MRLSGAALVQPVFGLFLPPQGPFSRPWATPIQPRSTGLPRGHMGCLVLGILYPVLGPFHRGGLPCPPPFWVLAAVLAQLVLFFSFTQLQSFCRLGTSPIQQPFRVDSMPGPVLMQLASSLWSTFLNATTDHRLLLAILHPLFFLPIYIPFCLQVGVPYIDLSYFVFPT
jgi:hypothetical protein